MFEEVEQSCFVSSERFRHPCKDSDSGGHGILEPSIEETLGAFQILLVPKEPELLFHGVSEEKRLVDLKEGIDSGLPVGIKGVIVAKEEKAIALEGLLPKIVQFPLLLPSELINRLVHESRDMIVVKDDIHAGQAPANGGKVTSTHVHGHRLEFLGFSGKLLQEGTDIFFPFALNGVEDSPRLDIREDGHVFVAFFQTELVDSNVFDLVQRHGFVQQREPLFVDLFDQVPSHSEVLGNRADSAKPQEIQNRESKRSHVPVFPIHEGQGGPPKMTTSAALQPVQQDFEKALLPSHGRHLQKPSILPFERSLPIATVRALHVLVGHPTTDEKVVPKVAGCFIMDTSHPKSMVQYGRGHGSISPPVVRLPSNNWGSCHVHSFLSIAGYSLSG